MSCRNCMGSCIHHKIEDIYEIIDDGFIRMKEFKGYKHFCDKDQEAYEAWHKRNEKNTYDKYKLDEMPCFEPTDLAAQLDKCIDAANNLLEYLEKDKRQNNEDN